MAVPSTLFDLSTTAASNSPAGSESIGTSLDDYLRAIQAIMKQGASKGADIASAGTITPVATSAYFVVTGTTTITAIGETYSWVGRVITLKFSGALTLTNSAGLILPGAEDFSTIAGVVLSFVNESAGVWRCIQSGKYAYTGANTFTGDQTLGENVGIVLDAALSADGKYSGIVEAGTSSDALAFGELCYKVTATEKWALAKGDAASTSTNELGICVLAAAGADAATTMLKFGKVRADSLYDTFTVGAPLYISAATAGKIVSTAPTGTVDFVVRAIGQAEDANTVFFDPDNIWVTMDASSKLKTVAGVSAGSGVLVQAVAATKTDTFSLASATLTDITGLSVTTAAMASSSSKVAITVSLGRIAINTAAGVTVAFRLMRDSTPIAVGDLVGSAPQVTFVVSVSNANLHYSAGGYSFTWYDSPGDASAHTYKLQMATESGAQGYINRNYNNDGSATTYAATSVSAILVQEFAS